MLVRVIARCHWMLPTVTDQCGSFVAEITLKILDSDVLYLTYR